MKIKSPTQLIFERKGKLFKFTPNELFRAEQRAKKRVTSYQKRNINTSQKTTTKKGKTEYQRKLMRIIRAEERERRKR